MLAGHLDTYADEGPDAFVFTSIKGSPLLNRYFAPSWKRALKEAALPETTRFADLRPRTTRVGRGYAGDRPRVMEL